ncbi:hypothetical protein [Nocardiopsis sp. CC223A]|uniref:hypothetical protein n=1 Tax=Nocardiopsis sp. CC223A TaxID=3044051 RepID=UPI00278C81DA|nr:hypothetical protein [Nocardiopsis sp. CC223A]
MAVASAVFACFFLAIGVLVVGHEVRALGAAYGWSGESGRVTVTHEEGSGNETRCYGTYRPGEDAVREEVLVYSSGEDAVREEVLVYSSGECTPGRVADVRLVPGKDTWAATTTADRVYEDAGFGSGVGGSLVAVVLVGAFGFGLGGLLGLGAAALLGGLVLEALRRVLPRQSN